MTVIQMLSTSQTALKCRRNRLNLKHQAPFRAHTRDPLCETPGREKHAEREVGRLLALLAMRTPLPLEVVSQALGGGSECVDCFDGSAVDGFSPVAAEYADAR